MIHVTACEEDKKVLLRLVTLLESGFLFSFFLPEKLPFRIGEMALRCGTHADLRRPLFDQETTTVHRQQLSYFKNCRTTESALAMALVLSS